MRYILCALFSLIIYVLFFPAACVNRRFKVELAIFIDIQKFLFNTRKMCINEFATNGMVMMSILRDKYR